MQPLLVTHCGAGSDSAVQDAADVAGEEGMSILRRNGRALDAVIAAIVSLENDPRTNAGTGSRMRVDDRVQMDAALMNGDLEAGAVAAIEFVRNPILVARDVFRTPHVLLVGRDATDFARAHGHAHYDPATPESRRKLKESLNRIRDGHLPRYARRWRRIEWAGTVGAVARDRRGRYAAGSSTGGTSFMMPGRVGDTPILGAGVYAGSKGAVSVTGIGEEIMKRVLAKFVYDRIEAGSTAHRAVDQGLELFPRDVPVGIIAAGGRGVGVGCRGDMAHFVSGRRRTL